MLPHFACAVAAASLAQPAPFAATVTVNLSDSSPAEFPHTWKRIFGSGHAALGLRSDYLVQLDEAWHELGLQGVRQHGLFDDDMGPVVTAHRAYNFSLVERLWASFVERGLVPVVELSYMPARLANCSWSPAKAACHAEEGLPCAAGAGAPCPQTMAYGGVVKPPTDWDDWRHLVQSAAQLAVDRFGIGR